ncbi:polycystin family receptor for egg jelly-like [Dama dama]|uniref:polycystin family receptor for egg jelly-like n=1 Tax=Dama dama TaxID=30532 RepID=UPI002A36229C|nr:polycystin family receptor for egg jelly-like [Dama dama]
MTGVEATGDGIEIPPDAVEVYLIRKNLSFGTFNLTVGPSSEPYAVDESLRKTTGAFSFVVDCTAGRDVLIHIMAEVSVLFTVSVYAGREITPNSFMTSYLVPHKIPPIANESDLFDPECPVKEARVVCLPAALLQLIAQRTASSECTVGVLLQAPRFVLKRNNKLVRISVFSITCLNMFGIQSDWREDTCIVGERTTWQRVHCVCKNPRRAKRQLDIIKQANLHLRTHYLTAKVIVVPNPVDLHLEVIKKITQNPVTLFTEIEAEPQEQRYIRSMVIGLESAFITLPVQLVITSLFIYSQRRPLVSLNEVTPRKHPLKPAANEHWEERLGKWHAYEINKTHSQEPEKSNSHPAKPKSSVEVTSKGQPPPKQAESKVSGTQKKISGTQSKVSRPQKDVSRTQRKVSGTLRKVSDTPGKASGTQRKISRAQEKNKNTNNPNVEDNQSVSSEDLPPQPGSRALKEKPRMVLPRCCVSVAWLLVFLTCAVSSYFIIFYGLTYGLEKSIAWLFASFCAFTLSVFLVQPSKIMLLSSYRTSAAKYSKNLSWISNYHFTEIKLQNLWKDPEEMDRRHQFVMELRNSRMYQPLTQDEITIFKRKKRIKRRAFLFLIYILTHFIFLALLLSLVTILRPTDSFYYNQFIRDQFSVDLAGVTRLEGIYQWLNGVLLPLLHNDPNPTFLPDSSSKILGLPLMRQVRAQPGEITCLPAKKFVEGSLKGEIRCHPEYGMDPEDTKNYSGSWNKVSKRDTDKTTKGFTYKPPEKRWAYASHGLLHTYGSGGYTFYFFPAEQQFNSTLRLSELQKSHWLDEKTWSVIVELTTFNPDISLLCSISVIFEVSQLGVVNTSLNAHSFSLTHFNRKYSEEIYLYVAIYLFFLAYIADEVNVITDEWTAYVKSVYNWVSFALKFFLALLIVFFFRKYFLAIGVVRAYLSNPEDFIPFHAVAQVDHTMKMILGFLVFLTVLKTLRYSRVFYDVRLAQRAIQIALPGICHMALMLSVYFFVFMAFGYLVFGQDEWNYSDMIHATQTAVSYCVSAFQNTEFFNNRVLGILFLSSFILVMICILINLFRAVILSAYEEMKQPVYEEPSEEAEAMTYLCRRLRSAFCCLCFKPRAEDEPKFFINMVYGQPEKNSRRYLGLKTRNINGKKMVYLVV